MAIELPDFTADELDDRARALIRMHQVNDLGQRDADVRVGSDYDIWARILRAVAMMMQSAALGAKRALDPRQAFGSFIRQYAENWAIGEELQKTAYQAQAATGRAIVLSSTGSQVLPGGTQLAHGDGTRFTTPGGTTPAAASKSFTIGHRSTRRTLYMGATAASAAASEVYTCAAIGVTIALADVGILGATPYRWVQPWVTLLAQPVLGQLYQQVIGTVVQLTAVQTGPRGNKASGDALSFPTPVGTYTSGIVLSLTGGRDALTAAQAQKAIRDLLGTRLAMMTLEDIRQLALATPGVDLRDAYVFPAYRLSGGGSAGGGEIDIYPIGRERCVVSQADVNAITTHVRNNATPDLTITAIKPSFYDAAYATNWRTSIKVSREFSPDWARTDYATPIVADGASTTTRVQFSGGSLPTTLDTLKVGARVILSIARGATQDEDPCLLVRRVTALGANYFDVGDPLPYAPTIAWVSQGGPYADDLVAACDEFFDDQAPYTATFHRHPHPDAPYGIEAFSGAVAKVPGVLDAVVDGAQTLAEYSVFWPKYLLFVVQSA